MAITPEQLARSNTEHGHQAALFCYAASSGIPELKWLYAIPNGGLRDKITAGKLKAEGLKSGVADICLPVNRQSTWINNHHYYGLYMEMKHQKYRTHKDGGLSQEQVEFRDFVVAQGYQFVVCYTWIEAKDAILRYLGRM